MLEEIVRRLDALPVVAAWRVHARRVRRHEIYLLGGRREAERAVEDESYDLTLFVPAGAGELGSASLVLSRAERATLDARLAAAAERAALVANPAFPLPPPQPCPAVQVADPLVLDNARGAVEEAAGQILAELASEPAVRLGSAEIAAAVVEEEVRTSSGQHLAWPATESYLELALLARGRGHEVEELGAYVDRRAPAHTVARRLRGLVERAREQLEAGAAPTFNGPVLLSGEALPELFLPILFHASAEAAYDGDVAIAPGDPIYSERPLRGEPLVLSTDPGLAWGVQSAPCDPDGVPARRVELVRDGRLVQRWAPARYAHYLGIPATGRYGNLVVGTGATRIAALRETSLLEVTAFSWLNPDPITGNFAAEIRRGYARVGKARRPVRGGVVSGNVFAALADAVFSAEGEEIAPHDSELTDGPGTYVGPAGVRCAYLAAAG